MVIRHGKAMGKSRLPDGQALQQCLRFWPGEALLLRALAQSALRLGDLPRWGILSIDVPNSHWIHWLVDEFIELDDGKIETGKPYIWW